MKRSQQARREARRHMTVRVTPLRDHVAGPSAAETAEDRLALLDTLSRESWELTSLPVPTYTRSEMPIRVLNRASTAPA